MLKKRHAIILGAAAAGVYSALAGKGIFNKIRYKEQARAISDYMRSHHPGAEFGEITPTQKGYMTVISPGDGSPKIILYAVKTPQGVYVFHETEVINS